MLSRDDVEMEKEVVESLNLCHDFLGFKNMTLQNRPLLT